MTFSLEHSLCEAAGLLGRSTERALFMLPRLDLYDEGVLAPHNISSLHGVVVPMEHENLQLSNMNSPLSSSLFHILLRSLFRILPSNAWVLAPPKAGRASRGFLCGP